MFKQILIAVATCAAFAAPAQADTVLTFDGAGVMQNNHADGYTGIGDTYVQDGFTLTVGAGDHFDDMYSYGLYLHNGSANDNYDNWARLTFSGGLFNLNSFQFNWYAGEIRTNLNPSITTYAAGTHAVNLTGLSWVDFSAIGGGENYENLYLDNVAVSAGAEVPEPSSLALLGLALFGVSALRSRKA